MSLIGLRRHLARKLGKNQIAKLRRFQALRFRTFQHFIFRLFIGRDLKSLATVNNTDKWGSHWYAQHYQKHFAHLRRKKLNILEIGVGGYDDPEQGGGSLRMWRTYFPNSNIFAIDIHDKSPHNERRIKIFKGSQVDEKCLDEAIRTMGHIDIIIDDGSHMNEHVLFTFKYLFPHLSQNGIYVVEDTQTSYWKEYNGTTAELNSQNTIMGFFKSLVDCLNYSEFEKEGYLPSYYDQNIIAMHFYHNMVFIQKGLNNEGSNIRKS